ncbi:hypothetical protein C8R43DRAFT_1142751 [Mycena crocata]|nr:hypothetical protein C8R43DRAFT_1142751 [Mycena crocata]
MLRGSITNDLVAAVAPYSPQWETLACVVSTPAAFPAGELVRGRLPLLKTLNLASGVDDEDLDGTITVFADAPQLRRLRLSGHIVDSVSLPWTQLTHLTLVGQGIDECLRILQLTMNLETLSVDAAHPLTHPLPIHLPRLHTLKLQHSPESYEILRCLTLPVLNHLELHHLDFSDIVPVTHFLMRSASPLHRLTLHRPELPLVRECLHAATTLRAVCIRDAPWSEGSVTALCTALVHEPGFLPNLRSLVLNPCTTAVELPYADLADMLAARCGGRANGDDDVTLRLETDTPDLARLESCQEEPPDMAEIQRGLDKLRALAADGQKISIRGLHKISSGMVDADAVRPPLHGYMLE